MILTLKQLITSKKITCKDGGEVLGETFSIKERKIKTRDRGFTKLKHKLKVSRKYIFRLLLT